MNPIIITDPESILPCLESCPDGSQIQLRFPEKQVHLNAQNVPYVEKYYYISNNTHGLKRVAFPIIRKKNISIDGGGAELIFDGELVPFVVEDSENISLKNFSIDWKRPFYSEGTVVAADETGVTLDIDRCTYPYRVEGERIIFEGYDWEYSLTHGVFAIDEKTHAPAFRSGDSMGLGFPEHIKVKEIGPNRIQLAESFPNLPRIGNVVVLRHSNRNIPAICFFGCKDIELDDVIIYHAGAMGVIAQFCEDLTLRRVQVTPSGNRHFSAAVDATHFVNCRGHILIDSCLFEGQLDDPANIHGINSRVAEVLDTHRVLIELVHHEQHGVEIGFPGDSMHIVDNQTLLAYDKNTVVDVERRNERYSVVRFEKPLPDQLVPGHVLENMSWVPDLTVKKCVARNNRARGFLISTPGKVLIENNKIESSGAAIKISGDANYWFESGAVRNVTIRNNDFGDCCYGVPAWGKAVIDIDPEIENPENNPACFHSNIKILDNRFTTFDEAILFARSVDGLVFKGNSIEPSFNYPKSSNASKAITLESCQRVEIEEANILV